HPAGGELRANRVERGVDPEGDPRAEDAAKERVERGGPVRGRRERRSRRLEVDRRRDRLALVRDGERARSRSPEREPEREDPGEEGAGEKRAHGRGRGRGS